MTSLAAAAALYQQGRGPEAQALCEDILQREPRNAGVLHLLGLIHYQAGRATRGAAFIGQAVAIHPHDPSMLANHAAALMESGAYADAVRAADAALTLNPQFARAHTNRTAAILNWAKTLKNDAVAALGAGNMAAAHDNLAAALKLTPDDADVRVSLGILQLQRGEFGAGFVNYAQRWDSGALNLPQRGFVAPLWTGEDVAGKTILLHNEQGFGDAIQFSRYAPLVAARGAHVILEVGAAVVPLLKQLPGVAEVIARGADLPRLDFHCPLLSLPQAFKTEVESIPPPVVLKADPAKVALWRDRLGPKSRPRIGLTWSGNVRQANDANRSVALKDLAGALPPGFDYVSLQKEVRAADAEALRTHSHIRHFGADLADFSDTAALCDQMDHVVSVCTSTAHLAGAMGKPTAVLLCFDPCWRWLLARGDSPWYPSVTLYRQDQSGDWCGVLARLGAAVTRIS